MFTLICNYTPNLYVYVCIELMKNCTNSFLPEDSGLLHEILWPTSVITSVKNKARLCVGKVTCVPTNGWKQTPTVLMSKEAGGKGHESSCEWMPD